MNIRKTVLACTILIGILLAAIYRNELDMQAVQTWIRDADGLAPLVFCLLYIMATVFFLPGALLTLIGGALFGPVLGTVYSLTAATLGATLSFLIARYVAAAWVEKKTAGRLKPLINGVEEEGWRFVAFTRLVPLFPFNLLNYALGLTKIKLTHYILATAVFMLPGATAYTWLGYAGKQLLNGSETLVQHSLLAIALLAVVVFLPRLLKRWKNNGKGVGNQ